MSKTSTRRCRILRARARHEEQNWILVARCEFAFQGVCGMPPRSKGKSSSRPPNGSSHHTHQSSSVRFGEDLRMLIRNAADERAFADFIISNISKLSMECRVDVVMARLESRASGLTDDER